jgi:uncharacterized protein (DUF305 family)
MRRTVISLAAVAIGLAAAGVALGFGGIGGPPRAAPTMGAPAGAMDPPAASKHFIEMMIPHHDEAVAMAELAREKAERSEVRTLAETIARVQRAEIVQMRAWYLEWYGSEVPARDASGRSNGLEALEAAVQFDRAFLAEMIRHHAMGVRMVSMLQPRVDRPELAALMTAMADTQRAEIEQMRSWYADWYGGEPQAPLGPRGGMGPGMGMGMGMGMGAREGRPCAGTPSRARAGGARATRSKAAARRGQAAGRRAGTAARPATPRRR